MDVYLEVPASEQTFGGSIKGIVNQFLIIANLNTFLGDFFPSFLPNLFDVKNFMGTAPCYLFNSISCLGKNKFRVCVKIF